MPEIFKILATVLNMAITLYIWVIIVNVAMSWLIGFGVINQYNRFVGLVWSGTNDLIGPVLRPIRRFMPSFGGLDLSPVILVLILLFFQMVLQRIASGVSLF